MLKLSREDLGVRATCLLAAFGTSPDSDAEHARAIAGAVLLAKALQELENIRRALTPSKKKT